jgi:hypothetical protein
VYNAVSEANRIAREETTYDAVFQVSWGPASYELKENPAISAVKCIERK